MGVEPTLDSPTAEQTVLKTARPTGARAPPCRREAVRQTRAAIPSPPPPTRPARREASRAPRAAQRDRSARLGILDAPAPREDRGRDAEATPWRFGRRRGRPPRTIIRARLRRRLPRSGRARRARGKRAARRSGVSGWNPRPRSPVPSPREPGATLFEPARSMPAPDRGLGRWAARSARGAPCPKTLSPCSTFEGA